MNASSVRLAVSNDIEGWLALAREVEHLFGPMSEVPEFKKALMTAISDNRAFTASMNSLESGHSVPGGIVISKEANSIEWLAVSASARGLGIGGQLLETALSQLDPARPISVQTFAPSIPEGLAARHLYQKSGFKDREHMEPNPAGIDTVLMIKRPCPQVS